MDEAGSAEERCGGERGQGRIAAEARDDGRRVGAHRPQLREGACRDRERRECPGEEGALGEGARGRHLPFDLRRKAPGIARAARVGGEAHPPAAIEHGLGQRLRREHVAPGPAGGDDEERGAGVGQRDPPSMSWISWRGRLRVRASSAPRPSPAAISEEPP